MQKYLKVDANGNKVDMNEGEKIELLKRIDTREFETNLIKDTLQFDKPVSAYIQRVM